MYNIKRLKAIFRHMLEEGKEVNPQIESQRYSVKITTASAALEELVEEKSAKRVCMYKISIGKYIYPFYTYRHTHPRNDAAVEVGSPIL